jgi:hypothetical protein
MHRKPRDGHLLFVLLGVMAMFVISGCAEHLKRVTEPRIVYDDVRHPWSDTAVVAGRPGASFEMIDGKVVGSLTYGYPAWIRVLPGSHVVRLHVTSTAEQTLSTGAADITIEAQPRHVYEILPQIDQAMSSFSPTVRDLGENANYFKELGLPKKTYYVSFDGP